MVPGRKQSSHPDVLVVIDIAAIVIVACVVTEKVMASMMVQFSFAFIFICLTERMTSFVHYPG